MCGTSARARPGQVRSGPFGDMDSTFQQIQRCHESLLKLLTISSSIPWDWLLTLVAGSWRINATCIP